MYNYLVVYNTNFLPYCMFIYICCEWISQFTDYILQVYIIGNDAEVRPYVRMCYSRYGDYFSWTIYISEGVLLAFGAFLAWETRHVNFNFSYFSSFIHTSHAQFSCL